jgi:ABC-type sugar transport system ATPase subunit
MIAFSRITKRFPGVTALSDVTFDVASGSCHAICGENGAGKSTLGKTLAGIHSPDAGTITIDGRTVRFSSPRDALAAGVAIVHQELAFCENMTVAENLCLGRLPSRFGIVDRAALRATAAELLGAIGARVAVDRPMDTLSVAEQQLVQIAAAVGSGARVLVFDEPTSSLDEDDVARLFALIRDLRARGVTIIYVSHRMAEIYRLCDTITVLRDGRHIATRPVAELDEAELVRLMIGRSLEQYFPAHVGAARGDVLLRVDGLSRAGAFDDVSFSVHAGEVVGLAGLVGAGRSELARAVFGLEAPTAGSIMVRGGPADVRSPHDAMALGIGFVPEDRKKQGLVLPMRAGDNSTLPMLGTFANLGWIDRQRERTAVDDLFARLRLRAAAQVATASLSGGNQQKVVMAKWLAANSEILILDEPTRGVDVGAKAEIHAWIDELASRGCGVLLISSELPELINLSSRILVLRHGRLVGELSRADATQAALLRMMTGLAEHATPRDEAHAGVANHLL